MERFLNSIVHPLAIPSWRNTAAEVIPFFWCHVGQDNDKIKQFCKNRNKIIKQRGKKHKKN